MVARHENPARAGRANHAHLGVEPALGLGAIGGAGIRQPAGVDVVTEEHDHGMGRGGRRGPQRREHGL